MSFLKALGRLTQGVVETAVKLPISVARDVVCLPVDAADDVFDGEGMARSTRETLKKATKRLDEAVDEL